MYLRTWAMLTAVAEKIFIFTEMFILKRCIKVLSNSMQKNTCAIKIKPHKLRAAKVIGLNSFLKIQLTVFY